MARLSALPQELSLQIFRLLEVGDKARLSATCKQYRAQLAPEFFKTIRLTNDERIAQSALGVIEAYGEYTTRIEFTGHCRPEDEITTPALTPAAAKILQGHLTPNLSTVSLKFNFRFEDGHEWDKGHPDASGFKIYGTCVFEGVETKEYIQEREKIWQWRALMNETWRALAANIYTTELILELIPKWTSTFYTEEFRQFLSRLKFATFNMYGVKDDFRTNTMDGFREFLSNLDTCFFHHMTGLERLTIHASDPLGLTGHYYIPLALGPEDLPRLESLKLERCFISPELVSFIQGHTKVLKSLDVKECVSGGGYEFAFDGISWSEFFDRVYEAKPTLTELIAGNGSNAHLTDEEGDRGYQFEDEPEDIQEIRRKLKADPRLRLFGHGQIDTKYGFLSLDEDANEDEFNDGSAQRAFDRLMGLVNENAAKAKQRVYE